MEANALSLIAQISLGLAGFAGILISLGRGPGKWHPADALRIRLLLINVLGSLFSSVVAVGLEASALWSAQSERIGAAILLLFILYYLHATIRGARRIEGAKVLFNFRIVVLYRTLAVLALIAQTVVVLGYGGRAGFLLYFAGLLWGIFYGSFGFVRLVYVRPREE